METHCFQLKPTRPPLITKLPTRVCWPKLLTLEPQLCQLVNQSLSGPKRKTMLKSSKISPFNPPQDHQQSHKKPLKLPNKLKPQLKLKLNQLLNPLLHLEKEYLQAHLPRQSPSKRVSTCRKFKAQVQMEES